MDWALRILRAVHTNLLEVDNIPKALQSAFPYVRAQFLDATCMMMMFGFTLLVFLRYYLEEDWANLEGFLPIFRRLQVSVHRKKSESRGD